MNLLIDTQVLVWLLSGDPRLRQNWVEQFGDPETRVCVSAITAWEYTDLQQRGRLPVEESIADIQSLFALEILDLPAACWTVAERLPDIHRDPVDRMLIAHALVSDLVLVTADASMKQYPVRTL